MQDLMGREIKVGDFVAYAQRKSSSLWVNIGKVLKVRDGKLKVRGIQIGWDNKPQLLTRDSSISCPERIVLVEPNEQYREMLKDFIPQMELAC